MLHTIYIIFIDLFFIYAGIIKKWHYDWCIRFWLNSGFVKRTVRTEVNITFESWLIQMFTEKECSNESPTVNWS